MAMIKCKMCGGDLRLIEGSTVCECEYCGTKQTVPSMDNEKKLTLFSRAGRLLRGCEFDKAAGVFETIVADFPEEAEAYWGLVLCKYGIEYVDDPATGKKIPTCHRSSFESVLDDPNYEQACENTDAVARRVYRDEARQIEELRQAILQVSGKEEPYEVFISYKETDEKGERTLDSVIAQDIYTELTERGHRTFFSRISLEDKLGTEYEPYIFAALNSAKVMLVVGTDYENFDSVWVKNEWSRFLKLIAAGQKKALIPVFKNMGAYDMPKEFAKLAAQDMGKVGAMQDLIRGVEKIIGKKQDKPAPTQPASPVYVSNEADARTTAAVKRGNLALEDGEYDKAKEYFDQALNLDAECAEAYYGMGLAEKKCRSGEEYIHRLCQGKRDRQRVNLRQDKDRIEAAVKTYCIPGYLEEDTIRRMYQDTGYYYRVSESTKALAEQSKREFEHNRNFSRAIRFAADGKAPSVLSFRDQVYASLRKLTTEAEKEDAANRQEAQNNYAAYLDKADETAKAAFEEAQASREEDYQDICRKQEQAKTEEDFRQVIDEIETNKLQRYKDCEERVEQCRQGIVQVHEDAERAAKREAEKAAAEEEERKRAAAEQADRERAEKEKASAAARKKKKKITAAAAILTIVVLAGALLYTKVIAPRNLSHAAPGDIVIFGSYEQDNIVNGPESIEWLVLAKENDRLLLISKYALDSRPYNTEREGVTWENCTLRSWLNDDFLKEAFSNEQQTKILTTEVSADKNPFFDTDPGNDTKDKVFLLSVAEATEYFDSDEARACLLTPFAGESVHYVSYCSVWLRSPGEDPEYAALANGSGDIPAISGAVNDERGVRPAMWISLGS